MLNLDGGIIESVASCPGLDSQWLSQAEIEFHKGGTYATTTGRVASYHCGNRGDFTIGSIGAGNVVVIEASRVVDAA